MSQLPAFPDGFLWGTATASYQIEGAVAEDGRGRSIWDTFSHTPGAIVTGDNGDVACDHYHRYAEDVDLMAGLGVDAYRFSIAWPRVLPDGTGAVNRAGLDFYERLTDALLERGITPCATLYHWDLPQVLEDRGGWLNRDVASWYAEYTQVVAAALGDRIPMWITLNEPWVAAFAGYAAGEHAPGRQEGMGAGAAVHHLLLAHGAGVDVLRGALPADARVGLTVNVSPAYPASDAPADAAAAGRSESWLDWLFADPALRGAYPDDVGQLMAMSGWVADGDLERIARPLDFLGLNYYNPTLVRAVDPAAAAPQGEPHGEDMLKAALGFETPDWPDVPHTAMGWPVVPDGLREVLVRFRDRYASALPPLYVTENGAAYDDVVETGADGPRVDDADRVAYLDTHLRAVRAAIDEGVDVRGYFCWSLLDNFEWAEGFAKRFGLVHVDYETQRRTPKASYDWYRRLIAGG